MITETTDNFWKVFEVTNLHLYFDILTQQIKREKKKERKYKSTIQLHI